MSIVAVHGPYTFGSQALEQAGPVLATVNPANGLIWTFKFTEPTTRVDADFDWVFTGGTPATAADTKTPAAVTYATPGDKTATLNVSGAGAGANPHPPAGAYPITITAVSGVAPLMAQQQTEQGEVPEDEEEAGYDPGDDTVAEVVEYAETHPDEVNDIIVAEEAGKNRVTLLNQLYALRDAE